MPDRSPETIWETALGQLELQVTRPNFETWLRSTVGLHIDGTEFVVGVQSDFAVEWLKSRMHSLVSRTISQLLGAPFSVTFHILGAQPFPGPPSANGQREPSAVFAPPLDLHPGLTFQSFVVVESNRLAHSAARRIACGDSPYNILVLCGGSGLGKTHLLHAIGHHAVEIGTPTVALTAESFVDRYGKAVRDGHPHTFRQLFQGCQLLLLDDLSFLAARSASQEQFFHIFNTLHTTDCSIVVTVDRSPHTVRGLTRRLQSRLQAGLLADLDLPPAHERLEILRAKAATLKQPIPDAVMHMVAEQPYETITELEGALNRITAYADLTRSAPCVDTALHALYPLGRPAQTPCPDQVLAAVCNHFHIPRDHLTGPSRARDVTYARHVAMYLLRQHGSHALTEIGQLLGGRDHSTVLHACRRIDREITNLPQTRTDIDQLRAALLKQPAA